MLPDRPPLRLILTARPPARRTGPHAMTGYECAAWLAVLLAFLLALAFAFAGPVEAALQAS